MTTFRAKIGNIVSPLLFSILTKAFPEILNISETEKKSGIGFSGVEFTVRTLWRTYGLSPWTISSTY